MDIPNRPQSDEITAPQQSWIGGSPIWNRSATWSDGIGRDPRSWRTGSSDLSAAEAALQDPKVRALLGQRIEMGLAAPLEIEPGGKMRRDRMAAEALAAQFAGIEIDSICRELAYAAWYGWSIAECIWDVSGSQVRLADLRPRSPRIIRWDTQTHMPLLLTRTAPGGIPLPAAKFVLVRAPRANGGWPHGPGLSNWCLWPIWFKQQTVRMWALALERFASPVALTRHRPNAPDSEIKLALEATEALATGASISLREGQDIELLESTKRTGADYADFLLRMDRMLADAITGQHATAEIGQHVGTGAAHLKILERLVAADARRICAALQTTIATWLTHWNFPGAAVPRLRRDLSPPEDLEARARRDATIAGASGLRPTRAYVEDIYGGQWEETSAPADGSAGTPPATPAAPARLAAGRAGDDDAVDRATAALLDDWEAMMTPAADPVIQAVRQASDFAGLRETLGRDDLFGAMDTEQIAASLGRAGAAAQIAEAGKDGPGGET